MLPLIAGILIFGMVVTTVMCLLVKSSGDLIDRKYEDQQQIKFREEWKKNKK